MSPISRQPRERIVVFGSINVDLVARVAAIPRPGETVLSRSYAVMCGGKGANQAVAAARLSPAGTVAMVGRVGDDAFGRMSTDNLGRNGVATAGVPMDRASTGCAFITVDGAGENAITVASGANGALCADDVPMDLLHAETIAVLQMEVPFEAALAVARRTKAAGGRVVWNLAPVPSAMRIEDLRALLHAADVLVANEHEVLAAAAIFGEATTDVLGAASFVAKAGRVLTVLTMGARGAIACFLDGSSQAVPAAKIDPVDTTGAGDTFVGALAAELAAGVDIIAALRTACVAGALACLAAGAQTAMPTRAEIQAHLQAHGQAIA